MTSARSAPSRERSSGQVSVRGTRADLEALGFYVCDPDLEGELIRALGAAGVEEVLGRAGSSSSFRTFQKQPQWRGRPVDAQLRRFFGSSAGKTRHAPLMVEALDLDRVPSRSRRYSRTSARAGSGGAPSPESRGAARIRQAHRPQRPRP